MTALRRLAALMAIVVIPVMVSACSQTMDLTDRVSSMVLPTSWTHASYGSRDKECLMRAMFFESNRSSREGLMAVGTVVMNRLRSGKHGDTICEVVGAPNQFAPGVMTRKMDSKALPDVEAAADAVLKGERNPKVRNAMYFHTAGLKFPYKNMHYTVVAGGNAFYERRGRKGEPVVLPPETSYSPPQVMVAEAQPAPAAMVAAPAYVAAAQAPVVATGSVAQAAPMVVAETESPDVALPMAINGATPSARPGTARQQIAAAFPPAPPAPAAPQTAAELPAQGSMPFGNADAEAGIAMTGEQGPAPAQPAMASYDVDPDDASAIGAMIVGQDASMPAYH